MRFRTPIIISALFTPIAILAALGSAGAGHGDYVWARILFPYTMISSLLFVTDSVPAAVNILLWIVIPIIQYPTYGVIMALANQTGKTSLAAAGLSILHLIAAALNFLVHNPNFS